MCKFYMCGMKVGLLICHLLILSLTCFAQAKIYLRYLGSFSVFVFFFFQTLYPPVSWFLAISLLTLSYFAMFYAQFTCLRTCLSVPFPLLVSL